MGSDLIAFGDHLVFDERLGICYNFDPRDVAKRRLEVLVETNCGDLDCFNCAFTAGICTYDVGFGTCFATPENNNRRQAWWKWYEDCYDRKRLCYSNQDALTKMSGSLDEAFGQGQRLSYTILPNLLSDVTTPRNYFCSWSVDLDPTKQYWLEISRDFNPMKETLGLNIVGKYESKEIMDEALRSTSPDKEWEIFLLKDASQL